MQLKMPLQHIFIQLTDALNQLSAAEYIKRSDILQHSTIGQHVRHIIELFLCLEKGYTEGTVNYEKRKRDHRIETDKDTAIQLLQDILQRVERPNKSIVLHAEDYDDMAGVVAIPSNYYREIAYNLEHSIHHMALIRVAVNEVSDVLLVQEFGVAYSTIKFRQQCAQ